MAEPMIPSRGYHGMGGEHLKTAQKSIQFTVEIGHAGHANSRHDKNQGHGGHFRCTGPHPSIRDSSRLCIRC